MTISYTEYKKAKDSIKPYRPGESFLKIRFGYSNILVMPYKDGVKFLEVLEAAEAMTSEYSDTRITPLNKESVRIEIMSKEEYGQIKLCGLLDCSLSELIEAEASFQSKTN